MVSRMLTRAKQIQQGQQTLPRTTAPLPQREETATAQSSWVLRRCDEQLAEVERAFLTLLSAFQTPMKLDALEKMFTMVKETPAIPRAALGRPVFQTLLARLINTRVLHDDGQAHAYTLHPLVRAHYQAHLEASSRAHLTDAFPTLQARGTRPLTPPSIPDLIEAVHHACRVGSYDAACEIYLGRIQQAQHGVLLYQLGVYEVTLMLLAEFFPNSDTGQLPAVDDVHQQSWILNEVGLCLTHLGRLREAEPFYKRALDLALDKRNWYNASIAGQNLTHLYYHMGNLAAGAEAASEALILARFMHDNELERDALVYGARSAFLYGEIDIAGEAFKRAAALTQTLNATPPMLHGLQGLWYAEYLYRAGDVATAGRVTEANLEAWAIAYGVRHDESRCHRLLGDLAGFYNTPSQTLGTGLLGMTDTGPLPTRQARGHYNKAVWIAQGVAHLPTLIEALIARGYWAARQLDSTEQLRQQAFSDLEEALQYAITGGYRCYEADIHVALAWAHLALSRHPPTYGIGNLQNPEAHRAIARQEAQRAQNLSANLNYHWAKMGAEEVLQTLE